MDFKALNILTADIDNKFNVGHEILCGGEVSYCFNDSVVNAECVIYDILAVAGYGRRNNVEVGVYTVNLLEERLDNFNGISS